MILPLPSSVPLFFGPFGPVAVRFDVAGHLSVQHPRWHSAKSQKRGTEDGRNPPGKAEEHTVFSPKFLSVYRDVHGFDDTLITASLSSGDVCCAVMFLKHKD